MFEMLTKIVKHSVLTFTVTKICLTVTWKNVQSFDLIAVSAHENEAICQTKFSKQFGI